MLAWAVEAKHWPEALRLVRAIESTLTLNGRWGAWAEVLQDGLQAAEALGDRAAKAWILHQLGTRALCLGDTATAQLLLSRALRLREALGDRIGAEITRHNLTQLPFPAQPIPSDPAARPTSHSWWEQLTTRLIHSKLACATGSHCRPYRHPGGLGLISGRIGPVVPIGYPHRRFRFCDNHSTDPGLAHTGHCHLDPDGDT